MQNGDAVRVRHMVDACRSILEFTGSIARQDLGSDEMRTLAVLRLLEVLGEAAKFVSADLRDRYPEIPGVRWRVPGTG